MNTILDNAISCLDEQIRLFEPREKKLPSRAKAPANELGTPPGNERDDYAEQLKQLRVALSNAIIKAHRLHERNESHISDSLKLIKGLSSPFEAQQVGKAADHLAAGKAHRITGSRALSLCAHDEVYKDVN